MAIGGAPAQPLFDDGTHGDVTAGDNLFSFTAIVTAGPGSIVAARDRCGPAEPQHRHDDRAECRGPAERRRGHQPDVWRWRQLAARLTGRISSSCSIVALSRSISRAGRCSTRHPEAPYRGESTPLVGRIGPGAYFLVWQAAGSGGTIDLPAPDASGETNMSGSAGKVALVASTTALTGACPSNRLVVDLVGYGASELLRRRRSRSNAPERNGRDSRGPGRRHERQRSRLLRGCAQPAQLERHSTHRERPGGAGCGLVRCDHALDGHGHAGQRPRKQHVRRHGRSDLDRRRASSGVLR